MFCKLFGCVWLATALLLAGCTTVEIHGAASLTSTAFGVLRLEPGPDAPVLIARVRGIGLVPTVMGATLGVSDQKLVLLSSASDCRAIFFVQSQEQSQQIVDLFKASGLDTKSICEMKGVEIK